MSEAGNAVKKQAAARDQCTQCRANRVAELKVSGHLMTLDTGMFCIFHAPGGSAAATGPAFPVCVFPCHHRRPDQPTRSGSARFVPMAGWIFPTARRWCGWSKGQPRSW